MIRTLGRMDFTNEFPKSMYNNGKDFAEGFLKLDGVEAEGEAKVQRKIEVRRVHGLTYKPFTRSSLGIIQCYYQLGGF